MAPVKRVAKEKKQNIALKKNVTSMKDKSTRKARSSQRSCLNDSNDVPATKLLLNDTPESSNVPATKIDSDTIPDAHQVEVPPKKIQEHENEIQQNQGLVNSLTSQRAEFQHDMSRARHTKKFNFSHFQRREIQQLRAEVESLKNQLTCNHMVFPDRQLSVSNQFGSENFGRSQYLFPPRFQPQRPLSLPGHIQYLPEFIHQQAYVTPLLAQGGVSYPLIHGRESSPMPFYFGPSQYNF